jgi:acid phosphatase
MSMRGTLPAALVAGLVMQAQGAARAQALTPLDTAIQTVVVIYEENRSFDNLFGRFPGANGLQSVTPAQYQQYDRNGNVKGALLPTLPPVWGGLTDYQSNAPQGQPVITQAQTMGMANKPFSLDGASGYLLSRNVITRDLYHRFYENQMQIDGGKNDMFAGWADSGGLVMGYWDGSSTNLWKYAQQNVLTDNFFLPAFGGSFLNHQYLIAAQPPVWPNCKPGYSSTYSSAAPNNTSNSGNPVLADYTIQPNPSAVQPDGVTLTVAPSSPASALNGPPTYVNSSTMTAAGCYLINTDQPAFKPSSVAAASSSKTYVNPAINANPSLYANPASNGVVPPQTNMTIGDELSAAGVNWAWYGAAFGCTLAGTCPTSTTANGASVPDFQYHHQPFNYFESFAPGTAARAAHLLDGGLQGAGFISAINAGQVANGLFFYKPEGDQNWHNGYDDITDADAHLGAVVSALQASPAYAHMMIVITYDENGGFWDHVAPPPGDQFGPGTRIPAVIISPYAKKAFVDHTQYDQSSIMRFAQRRWNLQKLPGEVLRDTAVAANATKAMQTIGDLTNALNISLPAAPAVPAVCLNATNTAAYANTTGAACPVSTVTYPATH